MITAELFWGREVGDFNIWCSGSINSAVLFFLFTLGNAKRNSNVLYVFRYIHMRLVVLHLNFSIFKSDLTMRNDLEVVFWLIFNFVICYNLINILHAISEITCLESLDIFISVKVNYTIVCWIVKQLFVTLNNKNDQLRWKCINERRKCF